MEEYKFKDRKSYLSALDSVMPDKYIQTRKVGTLTHTYIPQPIKQAIADDFFFFWNVINEEYIVIANELVCTVKLQFQPNYPKSDEMVCTGSAATPIQMTKGATVMDFPKKKRNNALELNIPSVRSEAIGNALTTLGNIFGRNLGRKAVTNDFKIRKNDK